MAIHHAQSAEIVSVRPLGARLPRDRTKTLVRTDTLEVIRLVVPAGKSIRPHEVPGEITVQCLEGVVRAFPFSIPGLVRKIRWFW